MKTVAEAARLAGVSVRTLQYYDKIGLLAPDGVTEAGYRLYGEPALERLQQVLFYRELGFALKDIAQILADPAFDVKRALEQHRALLVAKQERLARLTRHVDNLLKGGGRTEFDAFDESEIMELREKYAAEAKERWGHTEAWAQSEARAKGYSKEQWAEVDAAQQEVFEVFAASMDDGPAGAAAQEAVARWQAHISKYFYDCSDEILAGLGEMYAADERFRGNIDRTAEGLAEFMRDAIRVYCGEK